MSSESGERPDKGDKVNVGLTSEGASALRALMETGWFDLELDAYKAGVAVALAHGVDWSAPQSGFETKFNVGSLDRDSSLRQLILAMIPNAARPYEVAEKLADAGIRILKARLVDEQMSLRDALTSPGTTAPSIARSS